MARGHRLNTSIVLAAVHGLLGLSGLCVRSSHHSLAIEPCRKFIFPVYGCSGGVVTLRPPALSDRLHPVWVGQFACVTRGTAGSVLQVSPSPSYPSVPLPHAPCEGLDTQSKFPLRLEFKVHRWVQSMKE